MWTDMAVDSQIITLFFASAARHTPLLRFEEWLSYLDTEVDGEIVNSNRLTAGFQTHVIWYIAK